MEQRVLVLDAFYQPSRVITWERAVCMLYDRKAEVVEAVPGVILRSPSMQMEMPSIVRMLRRPRSKKVSIKFSRANVLLRDGYCCMYCGGSFDAKELNYDHVHPRSRGGKTDWDNIVMSCFACNAKKGDRTPEEAKMPLIKAPKKPAWLPVVHKRFDLKTVPDSWRPYFGKAA
jgi:5-methylcytosine-specific restriction endonuclease McrA